MKCLWIAALLALTACGGRVEAPNSTSSLPTPIASPSVVRVSPSPTKAVREILPTLVSPSPTPVFPKTIAFGSLVFHVPSTWGIDIQGNIAYLGPLAGGPNDLSLRVYKSFGSSLDALAPVNCPQEGDPPTSATKVEVVNSGQTIIAGKQAVYRSWRVTCASGTTIHTAWVVGDMAIYEQIPSAEAEAVVRGATNRN